jgi:hypothetical protein
MFLFLKASGSYSRNEDWPTGRRWLIAVHKPAPPLARKLRPAQT